MEPLYARICACALIGILIAPLTNGQLGYSTYQQVMGSGGPQGAPGMGGQPFAAGLPYGGISNTFLNAGGYRYDPQVGVVGPPGFGGGYEQLGIGQYPFVDPKTYWFLAGVSASSSLKAAQSVLFASLLSALLILKVR